MKRLLVTGASGLLGLNLIAQAAGRYEIFGLLRRERLSAQSCFAFHPLTGDLTQSGQAEHLLDLSQPDVVIHCAALTDVDYCEQYPEHADLLNAQAPHALAKATARQGVTLLHISTDAVFDGARGDYCEEDEPRPLNAYARSKLQGERLVSQANPDALIARVNFYGWSWQGRRSLSEWFFNNLAAGLPVNGFTDLVFNPLLANDMVEILLRAVEKRLTGLYHVVSSEGLSKFAFGRMLARQFGFNEALISPASYKLAQLQAPRARLLTLRSDRLACALGEALPGQAEAIRRFYELYLQGYPKTLRSVFDAPDQTSVG